MNREKISKILFPVNNRIKNLKINIDYFRIAGQESASQYYPVTANQISHYYNSAKYVIPYFTNGDEEGVVNGQTWKSGVSYSLDYSILNTGLNTNKQTVFYFGAGPQIESIEFDSEEDLSNIYVYPQDIKIDGDIVPSASWSIIKNENHYIIQNTRSHDALYTLPYSTKDYYVIEGNLKRGTTPLVYFEKLAPTKIPFNPEAVSTVMLSFDDEDNEGLIQTLDLFDELLDSNEEINEEINPIDEKAEE